MTKQTTFKKALCLLLTLAAALCLFSAAAAAAQTETADYYLSYKKFVAAEDPRFCVTPQGLDVLTAYLSKEEPK